MEGNALLLEITSTSRRATVSVTHCVCSWRANKLVNKILSLHD